MNKPVKFKAFSFNAGGCIDDEVEIAILVDGDKAYLHITDSDSEIMGSFEFPVETLVATVESVALLSNLYKK